MFRTEAAPDYEHNMSPLNKIITGTNSTSSKSSTSTTSSTIFLLIFTFRIKHVIAFLKQPEES